MIGVTSAGEGRLRIGVSMHMIDPGRRYHAARPSAKAAPAPRPAGARGRPSPEGIQLEVRTGARGPPPECAIGFSSRGFIY